MKKSFSSKYTYKAPSYKDNEEVKKGENTDE